MSVMMMEQRVVVWTDEVGIQRTDTTSIALMMVEWLSLALVLIGTTSKFWLV